MDKQRCQSISLHPGRWDARGAVGRKGWCSGAQGMVQWGAGGDALGRKRWRNGKIHPSDFYTSSIILAVERERSLTATK